MEWRKQKLIDIASMFDDGNWIESKDQSASGFWLVQTGNVGILSFRDKEVKRFVSEETFKRLNCTEIFSGDILISRLPDPIGRSCVVPKIPYRMLTAVDCTILRLKDGYDTRYINYCLNTEQSKEQVYKLITGSSRKRISRKNLATVEIPIPFTNGRPDLAEQKLIADGLDKILLLQSKASNDIANTDYLFSATSKQMLEDYKERSEKRTLGEECQIIKGKSPTLKTPEGQYPFVVTSQKRRSANTFQFDGEAVCIPLVSSTGHGHASLHRIHYEKGKFALANILAAVVPKDTSKLNTKYLYYYLSFYKDELLVPLMRGVANVTIPIQKLNDVVIAVPALDEQKKIVDVLEDVERLESSLMRRQNLVESYFASSLNLAFSET